MSSDCSFLDKANSGKRCLRINVIRDPDLTTVIFPEYISSSEDWNILRESLIVEVAFGGGLRVSNFSFKRFSYDYV